MLTRTSRSGDPHSDCSSDTTEWEVEEVLDKRFCPGNDGKESFEYLIKWVGYEETQWKLSDELESCEQLVKKFEATVSRRSARHQKRSGRGRAPASNTVAALAALATAPNSSQATERPAEETIRAVNQHDNLALPTASISESTAALLTPRSPGDRPSVNEIRLHFIRKLRDINDRSYTWAPKYVIEISKHLNEDWARRRHERRGWDSEVEAVILYLKDQGYSKESDQLSAYLLSSAIVTETSQWEVPFFVPGKGGSELLSFKGPARNTDPGFETQAAERESSECELIDGEDEHDPVVLPRTTVEDERAEEVAQFLSTVDAVEVDLDTAKLPSLALSDTKQHVFLAGNRAVCLQCPCQNVVVSTLRLESSAPRSDLFPRHLPHINQALHHFTSTHNEVFSDVGAMIRKYGQTGMLTPCDPCARSPSNPCSYFRQPQQMGHRRT